MDNSFGNCQEDKIEPKGKESVIMQYLTPHDTVDDVGKRVTKIIAQEMGKYENVICQYLTPFSNRVVKNFDFD